MTRLLATKPAVALFALLALCWSPQLRAGHPERLPDGETTSWRGYSAWLVEPTKRYGHGVLGDAIEAGGFALRLPGGRVIVYRLGQDAVFEDRRVRLHDLNGDGRPEAIIIKSYLRRGAPVAIYRLNNGAIVPLAEGPAIGTPNRWLNIAGIADFNGDGRIDIAYVQTPHLAGIVRIFEFRGQRLREIGSITGYTNHIIGSRDLDLAQVTGSRTGCCARLVIPVIGMRNRAVLGFRNGKLVELERR